MSPSHWGCSTVSVRLSILFVSMENSRMNVEWTLLTVPIRTIVLEQGPRQYRHPASLEIVGLAVLL